MTHIFYDSVEKAVNCNEKKSVDSLYRNIYEFKIKNIKIDSKYLKDFWPFEKKDYTFLMNDDFMKKFNLNKDLTIYSNENSVATSQISITLKIIIKS